jgi:ketosteroid isomerase-like protein
MKKIILFVFCVSTYVATFSQTAEDSVKATVNAMFTAMKNSDAKALINCFGDSAVLQSIGRNKEGLMVVRNESVAAFAQQIAGLPVNAADERISFETIKIDGPMAAAWTPYSFYLNGKFSHCGVNSFQLVRLNGSWKIQYIIDTRRRIGCVDK